jgi:Flp pilus assembly pilin Flp
MSALKKLLLDDSGQGLTEYAILIGTLALGAIITLLTVGSKLHTIFSAPEARLHALPSN